MYVLTEADGTKHKLVGAGPNLWVSNDSTYIRYDATAKKLTYRDGKFVLYEGFPSQGAFPTLFRPNRIEDTNGNFITIAYVNGKDQAIGLITDTLGRNISFVYDGTGKLASIKQGTKTYADFTWGAIPLSYNFTGLTVQGAPLSGTTQANVITDCKYANGTGYHFDYTDWDIIIKITKVSSNGTPQSWVRYNFPSTSQGALNDAPSFTQQFVSSDGVTEQTFAHDVTKANNLVSTYQVTDPSGTVNKTTFFTTAGDWRAGLVQSVDVLSGTMPLRRTTNDWTSDPSTNANPRVCRITTTLLDVTPNLMSQIEYRYQGEPTPCPATLAASSTGNVIQMDEYDFGFALKHRTVTTFLPATSNHILNLVSRVEVLDGAGTRMALTDFLYDGFGFTEMPAAVNHDESLTGPRGNLTTIKRYADAVAETGVISREFKYDWFGNLRIAQLDCCNQKKLTFTANTQFAYPEQIVRGPDVGPQLITSATYDNVTGLTLTLTDENGQQTNFGFDPLSDRPTSIDQPSGVSTPARLITTITYDDVSAQPGVTRSNNANSAGQSTIYDGTGRVRFQKLLQGSTVISTVETQHDDVNRTTKTSNPFAPGEAVVFTTTTRDALGRVKLVTPPSQGAQSFDYVGRQVTITDPAGKKRRNFMDALGRITEVHEPGPFPALAGTGFVDINGSLQSTGGAPGTGSVTVNGSVQPPTTVEVCDDFPPFNCRQITIYDSGTVRITVNNNFTKTATYNRFSTAITIANSLRSAINNDGSRPVDAGGTDATITLTARAGGAGTNYPLSASWTYNSEHFSQAFVYGHDFWSDPYRRRGRGGG